MTSQIFIIAGPNGAGKTSFAQRFLPRYVHCREFLNADLLAAGISPFAPETAAQAAGRALLRRMKELIRRKADFGFETTLAGRTYGSIFNAAKSQGFAMRLFYLWLPSVDLAIQRVKHRVRQGGHDVAEPIIRRRFKASLRNLFNLYLPLVDTWMLFDNSTLEPRTIARGEAGLIAMNDAELYNQIVEPWRE